ncbi:MAG: hypothetical protein RLZZ255_1718 [Cyanobacteriota bacterium]
MGGGGLSHTADTQLQCIHHPRGDRGESLLAAGWIAQRRFKRSLELADLQQGDTPARTAQTTPEVARVTAEGLGQALIDAAVGTMQGRDHAGTHPIGAVSVEVNFQGIATGRGMGLAHTPIGARVIAAVDGAHQRVIEADVEPALPAQIHHPPSHLKVPVELVADAGLHRRGTGKIHRGTGGSGTGDALGISVAGHHQNLHLAPQGAAAHPVALEAAAHTGERIAASTARCRSLGRNGQAQGGQQQACQQHSAAKAAQAGHAEGSGVEAPLSLRSGS